MPFSDVEPMSPVLHVVWLVFFGMLGACVGSFLNVVAWRLPRVEMRADEGELAWSWRALKALSHPPSACPKCGHGLAWYDNIPVLGWLSLRGKCRYCGEPISIRYPLVEATVGGLFAFYYVAFFLVGWGPPTPASAAEVVSPLGIVGFIPQRLPAEFLQDWPVFGMTLLLVACLVAATLIDAATYTIPLVIPWLAAIVGVVVHTIFDEPLRPLTVSADPTTSGVAIGATIGLAFSLVMVRAGLLRRSFVQDEPTPAAGLEEELVLPELTRREIYREMARELLFLLPPTVGAVLAGLATQVDVVAANFATPWVAGLGGALFGGLVAGAVVWAVRILGSIGFGREAMGLGDVHLMFGVGCCIGAGPATVAFFLAPLMGLLIALYLRLAHGQRELPFGPYLSAGTLVVLVVYNPVADYLGVSGAGGTSATLSLLPPTLWWMLGGIAAVAAVLFIVIALRDGSEKPEPAFRGSEIGQNR